MSKPSSSCHVLIDSSPDAAFSSPIAHVDVAHQNALRDGGVAGRQHTWHEFEDIRVIQDSSDFSDQRSSPQGLGLSYAPHAADSLATTRRTALFSNRTPDVNVVDSSMVYGSRVGAHDGTTPGTEHRQWLTPDSSRLSLPENEGRYEDISDQAQLIRNDSTKGMDQYCAAHGDILREKVSWLSIIFIALAIFSLLGSGVFLGIAIARPHWGGRIGRGKSMSYGTATFLCALFAKLVEISYACSYVAALGQFLSRKAFPKGSQSHPTSGISLAEMNLRLWILQPGTLITHWEGAKYVITTVLGIATLAASIAAMFYTTSVEALVSPKLRYGPNVTGLTFGQVATSFANPTYLSSNCQTSISKQIDPEFGGNTCLQISFAGNGFRNFETWQASWRARQLRNDDVASVPRPIPIAALYENTTVHGQWIRPFNEDIIADSAKHGRLVVNISMAMPHANVFRAASEPTNNILQPRDLGGAGEYYLKAAVPAPATNVLCVGAQEAEVRPLIGDEIEPPADWQTITTPIDDLFGWSNRPDNRTTFFHPWFGKLPIIYNTVGNTTSPYILPWIYMLSKPPPTTITNDYVLCGIRTFQYSDCSTNLFVAQSGSILSVHCGEDRDRWKSYSEAVGKSTGPMSMSVGATDWTSFGAEWIRSLALTTGISDGNASSGRLLTQMIPPYNGKDGGKLLPDVPTIAEGLAVLSGHTLLLSSDAAPFINNWNYTKNMLERPSLQSFHSMLSYRDYVSGGSQDWEGLFYVILAIVFLQNCVCVGLLVLYYLRYGEVTDYTETQNLFALAINSPPSQTLAGACGCGPTGEMLGRRWCVDMQPTSNEHSHSIGGQQGAHFYVRYPNDRPLAAASSVQATLDPATRTHRLSRFTGRSSPQTSPASHPGRRRKTGSAEIESFDIDDSPALIQYMKLVGRD